MKRTVSLDDIGIGVEMALDLLSSRNLCGSITRAIGISGPRSKQTESNFGGQCKGGASYIHFAPSALKQIPPVSPGGIALLVDHVNVGGFNQSPWMVWPQLFVIGPVDFSCRILLMNRSRTAGGALMNPLLKSTSSFQSSKR